MMVTQGTRARYLLLILVLAGVAGAAASGFADNGDASVGLYLVNAGVECGNSPKFGCEGSPELKGSLNTPYYVYLAAFNGDPEEGFAGLSCGIDYSAGSTVVQSWHVCSSAQELEFPNGGWPAPGGGNRIIFDRLTYCQTNEPEGNGVTAVFGYFYVTAYGDDQMRIIENRNLQSGPELRVANCESAETKLDPETRAGWVGFGSMDGDLPCVEKTETTWGHIKSTDWRQN